MTTDEQDTARLEWLVLGGGKKIAAVVQGNEQYGWRVCNCSDGLTIAGKGKTFREAIDDAMVKHP